MTKYVPASPTRGPSTAIFGPENTALIIIDMQTDFCGKGGYIDLLGYDISLTRALHRADRASVLARMRAGSTTSSTRARGTGPICPICPPTSAGARANRQQAAAVPASATRARAAACWCAAKPGWDIIPELAPLPGEPIIDKPGKGSFCATDLELMLRQRGIRNIVLTGITTDVCVHTTMREANDRGFECVILSDCCAATDRRQSPGRPQDGHHAKRRVRRGRDVRGALLEAMP